METVRITFTADTTVVPTAAARAFTSFSAETPVEEGVEGSDSEVGGVGEENGVKEVVVEELKKEEQPAETPSEEETGTEVLLEVVPTEDKEVLLEVVPTEETGSEEEVEAPQEEVVEEVFEEEVVETLVSEEEVV